MNQCAVIKVLEGLKNMHKTFNHDIIEYMYTDFTKSMFRAYEPIFRFSPVM